MAEYIIKTKSKKEEKIVKAFLSSLDNNFYEEQQEEEGLHRKMQMDRKTPLINGTKKKVSFSSLNLQNEGEDS